MNIIDFHNSARDYSANSDTTHYHSLLETAITDLLFRVEALEREVQSLRMAGLDTIIDIREQTQWMD